MKNIIYECPICGQALLAESKALVCFKNHSFDIAKEGYVNLLLRKVFKGLGDSQTSVEGRRRFLASGYYNFLSDKLNEKVLEYLPKTSISQVNILDIGCGEGFFLSRLKKFLLEESKNKNYHLWGLDDSKSAIRLASSSNPLIDFCVGNTNLLPFENSSVDFILSLSTSFNPSEVSRVLKKQGKLFVVTPGKDHFSALLRLIYGDFSPYKEDNDPTQSHSDLKWQETVVQKEILRVNGQEEISNLLVMSPHSSNLSKLQKENLLKLDELETEIDFKILIYSRV